MKEYKLIEASSAAELSAAVTAALNEGFSVSGSHQVCEQFGSVKYTQAVEKTVTA
jgi:hypothetical protein